MSKYRGTEVVTYKSPTEKVKDIAATRLISINNKLNSAQEELKKTPDDPKAKENYWKAQGALREITLLQMGIDKI